MRDPLSSYETTSNEYAKYLSDHKANVLTAFEWFEQNLPEVFENNNTNYKDDIEINILCHDTSKYTDKEFFPYAEYFYGDGNNQEEFDKAWLIHIHNNPHHWQYWVLCEDEGKTKVLDMEYPYIIEMICDWWSFSFKQDDLFEIFNWYEQHSKKMKLSFKTRNIVEDILALMEDTLDRWEYER